MGHLPWHLSCMGGRLCMGHCTPACSAHERDLPAGSTGRQGQGLPTGLPHAAAGRPNWLEGAADLAWQQGTLLPPDRIHSDLQQRKPQCTDLETELAGRKSPCAAS